MWVGLRGVMLQEIALQGNCSDPLSAGLPGLKLGETLKDGQCVLVASDDLAKDTRTGDHQVWWHNIYVLLKKPGVGDRVGQRRILTVGSRGNLWITNSAFEGDSLDSRALNAHFSSTTYLGGAPSARALYVDTTQPHDEARSRMLYTGQDLALFPFEHEVCR